MALALPLPSVLTGGGSRLEATSLRSPYAEVCFYVTVPPSAQADKTKSARPVNLCLWRYVGVVVGQPVEGGGGGCGMAPGPWKEGLCKCALVRQGRYRQVQRKEV